METLAPPQPQEMHVAPEQQLPLLAEQEAARLQQLDSNLLNDEARLDHLRTIYNGDIAAGKSSLDAHINVSSALKNTHGISELLPAEDDIASPYAQHAHSILKEVEKVMELPEAEFRARFPSPEKVARDQLVEERMDKERFNRGSRYMDAAGDLLQKQIEKQVDAELGTESAAKATQEESEKYYDDKAVIERSDAYDAATRAFDEKVDARLYKDAAFSPQEFTDMVDNSIVAFNAYADSVKLGPEEREKRLAILESMVDRRKAQLDEYTKKLAETKAEVDEHIEAITPEDEEVVANRTGLRRRFDNLKLRAGLFMAGEYKQMVGSLENDKEGELFTTRRRLIGAAAIAATGVLIFANHKNGWGLDLPFGGGKHLDIAPSGHTNIADVTPSRPGLSITSALDLDTHAESSKTIEHLAGKGDTVWSHAKNLLANHGNPNPDNQQIHAETQRLLDLNHWTWEQAKNLTEGTEITV